MWSVSGFDLGHDPDLTCWGSGDPTMGYVAILGMIGKSWKRARSLDAFRNGRFICKLASHEMVFRLFKQVTYYTL